MKRSALLGAALLCIGAAHAEDGFWLGIGADYSSGDYGSDITTDITSVPVTARYDSGNWTWRASLPWLRVDGDVGVLPGLGNVGNSNPQGRGRGKNGNNGEQRHWHRTSRHRKRYSPPASETCVFRRPMPSTPAARLAST